MSWTCSACRTINGPNDAECVTCGSPAGLAEPAPTAQVPVAELQPGTAGAGPNDPPVAAPAGHAPTAPAPANRGRRRTWLAMAAVIAIVVAGLAGFVGATVAGDDDRGPENASVDGRDVPAADDRGKAGDGDDEPSTADDEADQQKEKVTTTLPPAPVITTAPPVASEPSLGSTGSPGSVGAAGPPVPSEVTDTTRFWVAMRSSLEDEASARSFAASIPGSYAFFTDGFASLTPGYWVVAVGRYATADDALDYCRANGLTDDHDCIAVPISQDPADQTVRLSLETAG